MSRHDPNPIEYPNGETAYRHPRTMDELRAEALRLFPDDMPAHRGRKAGLSSIGRYTPEQLRSVHIKTYAPMMRRSASL